jgi:hypothetical protein
LSYSYRQTFRSHILHFVSSLTSFRVTVSLTNLYAVVRAVSLCGTNLMLRLSEYARQFLWFYPYL